MSIKINNLITIRTLSRPNSEGGKKTKVKDEMEKWTLDARLTTVEEEWGNTRQAFPVGE